LALAARTASSLVGSVFGFDAFRDFPALGIMGCTGVGAFEARSPGCVVIGPVPLSRLGIVDNSICPNWFEGAKKTRRVETAGFQ
jgi:hypothetical protein